MVSGQKGRRETGGEGKGKGGESVFAGRSKTGSRVQREQPILGAKGAIYPGAGEREKQNAGTHMRADTFLFYPPILPIFDGSDRMTP